MVTGIQDKHQNPPRPCHSLSHTLGHRPPISGVCQTQSSRLTPGVCRATGGPMPGPRVWELSGVGWAASAGAPRLGALCCWDSDGPTGAAALGSTPWLGMGGLSGDSPRSVLSLGIQPCCVCRCPGATPTLRACTACGLVHKHLCGVGVSLLLLFCQVKMRESGLGEAADRPRLTRLWSLPRPGRPASSPPQPPQPPPTTG